VKAARYAAFTKNIILVPGNMFVIFQKALILWALSACKIKAF